MKLFPEKDETDNGYETEEDQRKDNVAYGDISWSLLIMFVVICLIVYGQKQQRDLKVPFLILQKFLLFEFLLFLTSTYFFV